MRKIILTFSLILFLGVIPVLSSQDNDPLYQEISALKSVKALPEFVSWSYSFSRLNGKIEIHYPVLSKEQQKEHKVKNSALAKQAEKVKKEITGILSKKKFKTQWLQRKDKVKIKEQEFDGVILEGSFERAETEDDIKNDIKADIQVEKKRILAEIEEYDKQKSEWEEKAQAQDKAWQDYLKTPHLFNFNAKLAGAKFIHTEKIDAVNFLWIKEEAKTIVRALTFLSETEVKIQDEDSYEVYNIIDRNKYGLRLKHKNSGEERFITCWTDNSFIFGRAIFRRQGYKPSYKIEGKTFSDPEDALRAHFIKFYGAENIVKSNKQSSGHHVLFGTGERMKTFLPGGKVKLTEYVWQWKGKTIRFDPSDRGLYYSEIAAMEDSFQFRSGEFLKSIQKLMETINYSLSHADSLTIDQLRTLLDELKSYTIVKFERPYLIALEDTEQYTWTQKNNTVTLKNINSSSDSKKFLYTDDFRLFETNDKFQSIVNVYFWEDKEIWALRYGDANYETFAPFGRIYHQRESLYREEDALYLVE